MKRLKHFFDDCVYPDEVLGKCFMIAVIVLIVVICVCRFIIESEPKADIIKIQDNDPIIECVASGDCYRVYRDTTTQTLYLYATESGTFTIMKDLNGNIRFYEGK